MTIIDIISIALSFDTAGAWAEMHECVFSSAKKKVRVRLVHPCLDTMFQIHVALRSFVLGDKGTELAV